MPTSTSSRNLQSVTLWALTALLLLCPMFRVGEGWRLALRLPELQHC